MKTRSSNGSARSDSEMPKGCSSYQWSQQAGSDWGVPMLLAIYYNVGIAMVNHPLITINCEMNPPDHSDMSQRVASSVAPEVTAVGSAYQENPAVSDLIDFSPHPEKVSTSSSDTELLRNCLCSGKDTDSRNESNDI